MWGCVSGRGCRHRGAQCCCRRRDASGPPVLRRDAPGWQRAPFNPIIQEGDSPFSAITHCFPLSVSSNPFSALANIRRRMCCVFKEGGEAKAPQVLALPHQSTSQHCCLAHQHEHSGLSICQGGFLVKYREKGKRNAEVLANEHRDICCLRGRGGSEAETSVRVNTAEENIHSYS